MIVGAGPSGLAAAIRLKQLAAAGERDLGVCVVEKGSEVGAHILSGAVFEPRALGELIPDWRERGAAGHPAAEDRFLLLTKTRSLRLPTPPQMRITAITLSASAISALAGAAGRSARGRDLPGLRRGRGAV